MGTQSCGPWGIGLGFNRCAGVSVLGLCAAALVVETDAAAQSIPGQEPVLLAPITVEARRREEQLIDVPIGATVLDEFQVEEQRIRDVEDLARQVPSFQSSTFGDDPRSALPIIRGVGALASSLSPSNNTVPTIVDGAPLPGFAASLQLLDAGQIDVLRGPQGTFFGRNSTGGAINVTSVRPDDVPERSLTTEIGTEWFRSIEARLAGGLSDTVTGRLALRYQGQEDHLTNQQPGESDFGSLDIVAAAGTLNWQPGPQTNVRWTNRFEFDQRDAGFILLLRDDDAFQTEPFFERTIGISTLNVSHDLDNLALHSVTNITYYTVDVDSDLTDGLVFNRFLGLPPEASIPTNEFNLNDEREIQLYQEVRASSLPQADLSWVVGGVLSYNAFNEEAFSQSITFPAASGIRDVDLTTQSYSVFGDVSVPVFGRWEVGAGLRYSHEIINIDHTYVGVGTPGTVDFFEQDDTRRFNLIAGRFSVSYKPSDDSLLYASISRGAKSGGFPRNTNNAAIGLPEPGFEDTSNLAYELGAKADLWDGRVSLTVAGFFNDVEDEATISFDSRTFTFPTENLDLETYGFEAEATARLPHGFDVAGAVSFTESEITGVPVDSGSGASVGNPVPFVPRLSAGASLSYRGAPDFLGLGPDQDLNAFVGYRFIGSRSGEITDTIELNPEHIVDARVGFSFGSVDVYAFGENLVGDAIEQQASVIAPGVESVLVGRGRTVGVGLSVSF